MFRIIATIITVACGLSLFSSSPRAFYYVHLQTTVPVEYAQEFSRRHHLSESFKKLFDRGLENYNKMDFKRAEQVYNTLLLINSQDILALDKQAQVYLKQGQYELAVSTLTRLLQIDPTYFPAHNSLALAYLWLKDFRRSIQHSKFLVEHNHAFMETYQYLTSALFYLGQLDNVLSICRIARDSGATHPHFEFFPALIHLMQKDKDRYKSIMNDMATRFPAEELLFYRIVGAIYEQDTPQIAELMGKLDTLPSDHPTEHYMQLLVALDMLHYVAPWPQFLNLIHNIQTVLQKQNPNFVMPYFLASQMYRRVSDYNRILATATAGIQHFPSFIPLFEMQGEAAFFLDRHDIAKAALKTSLSKRTNNPNYLAYYAILLVADQKFEEGLEYLEKSSNLSPQNPFAQTALGYYYTQTGQPQRAEPHLKVAMETNIAYPLPYTLFIKAKEENRSFREAYTYALRARKILPQNEMIQEMATRLAFTQEEYNNCVFMCAEAMILFPQNQFFPVQRARAYQKIGDDKAAIKTLEDFGMTLDRPDTTLRLYLDLLMDAGRFDQAYKLVYELVGLFPRNRLYQEFLGRYYTQNLDYPKALKIYQELDKLYGRSIYIGDSGWLQFLSGNQKEALDALTLSINSAPETQIRALSHYRLGLIYSIASGKDQDSAQNYRMGAELHPRLTEAQADHIFYIKNSGNPRRSETVQKNMDLFLK
ncbi:MAG: tetratricopeptide repeat protein [Candidatus Cloacimonetes bacterium]|nr:tetratricopeptide repeat protein [Candidatus Cloacimonadota bacterium]